MKKRILLIIAMIALLVCLFAVSASAENALKPQTSNAYGDLSFFDESISVGRTDPKYGFTPYIDAEGPTYARVVVGDGTTFYTFPTAYVISNTTIYGEGQINIFVRDLTSLNSAMEAATGTNPNWNEDNIYRIEMPYSNIRFNGGSQQGFQGYDNLIEIWLQPNSHIKDQNKTMMFWKCYNLETIHNLDTFTFRNGCLGGAFQECKKLKNITLGYSAEVTKTDDSTFSGCTALQSVNLKEAFPNLTAVGKNCFYQCTNLVSTSSEEGVVSLPNGVTQIGYKDNGSAFYECKSMKYLSLPTSLTHMGTTAFRNCTALEFIDFNDNANDIEFYNYGHFMGCTALKAVSLSDNIKILNNRIFVSCTALKAVYLPASLEQMNTNGYGQGPFCYSNQMYFVNEPFEVRDENGNFYGDNFVMPTKPEVYFMPDNLSKAGGNVSSGTWFRECLGLNTTIVMPEAFKNSTVVQMFRDTANASNIKNVVYLGDMESIAWSERNHHINFIFANSNDTDISSITFSSFYNNLNNDCYFYFCKTGYRYTMNVSSAADIATTKVENTYLHLSNPKKAVVTPADCENPRKEVQECFCGADMGEKTIGEALGHDHDIANGAQVLGIAYNNGYLKSGTKTVKCIRCDETSTDQTIGAPVFGVSFSAKEEGTAFGILVQYNVAKEVLAEYYENTGKNLTVGVASIMKKNVNEDGTLLDANGNTTQDKVVTTPIAEQGLSAVMIKITGATSLWETYSSESIYVLGYVTDGTTLEYVGFAGGEASSSTSLNNMDAYLISEHLPEKENE